MEILNVYLLGQHVGTLSVEQGKLAFRYLPEYLQEKDAVAISYSLPLQPEPFSHQVSSVFFDNLLPPETVRKRLGKNLHLSRHNVFGFLKAIGGDCAGAITLYPPNETEDFATPVCLELSEEEAAQILNELPMRPLNLGREKGFRISGTGAQDKLIACLKDGKIFLPLFGMPSTHIIKPPVTVYPDSVFNEFFCMRLAKAMRIPAPACEILTLKGISYYCVTRFDRQVIDGKINRLHQEDFCQLFSVDPEKKYENEGGPNISNCFNLIKKLRLGAAGQVDFLRRIIFNVLIGNGDAHAKNFSVLYHGKNIQLAPVYDLLCTEIYDELAHETAMTIGGATAFPEITRESFKQMAQNCEIHSELVLNLLDELLAELPRISRSLAEELNLQYSSQIYEKICRIIERQAEKLSKA